MKRECFVKIEKSTDRWWMGGGWNYTRNYETCKNKVKENDKYCTFHKNRFAKWEREIK